MEKNNKIFIAGLKLCESFNLQYGTNFITVMPTNLYGPNDNFNLETGHVLPAMLRKIFLAYCRMTGDWKAIRRDLSRRPVQGMGGNRSDEEIDGLLERYGIYKDTVLLWGTGTPRREFLWSEELADACIFIMERVDFSDLKEYALARGCPPEQIRNCHVNIGTEEEISIRELAERVAQVIEYGGKLQFDSSKPDGVIRKLTDCTKLHALGWRHKTGVREGVQKLYRWYLDNSFAAY